MTLGAGDVAGIYSVALGNAVVLTCYLKSYPLITGTKYLPYVSVVGPDGCYTGNAIIHPTLPNIIINQSYVPTTIDAFKDSFSGFTTPPTCHFRTCTSDNSNVVWDNTSQLFTVKSLTSDVAKTESVILKCGLASYTTVPAEQSTF